MRPFMPEHSQSERRAQQEKDEFFFGIDGHDLTKSRMTARRILFRLFEINSVPNWEEGTRAEDVSPLVVNGRQTCEGGMKNSNNNTF